MTALYLVKMVETREADELGSATEIIVQLTDIGGKWFADFHANSWMFANVSLLAGLKEKGLRFVGSLPNFDPHQQAGEHSFWIVVERTPVQW